ncbi:hypothetical protein Phage2-1_00094 [Achromobacter phage 2-1]|nr:hypothetical protein Phage2-1_00094 [Achromobacter phage 2-1]
MEQVADRNLNPANTEAGRCLSFQQGWNDAQLGHALGQSHALAGICQDLDDAYRLGFDSARNTSHRRRITVPQATVRYLKLVVNNQ